jgi:hypothetical protein
MSLKVNWKPESGKSLPTKTPVNVDPKLNTISISNPTGFIPMRKVLPGENLDDVPHYSIANTGRILYKFGPGNILDFSQYTTINDFAAAAKSKYGAGPEVTELLRNYSQNEVTARAKSVGIIDPNAEPAPKDRPSGESDDDTETEVGSSDNGTDNTPQNIFGTTINDFYKAGSRNNEKLSQNISYPENMDQSQDRIVIVQRKYIPVEETGEVTVDFYKKIQKDRFATTPSEVIGSVVLPMPNDISESNVTAWGENSLSSLAALLGGGALKLASGISVVNLQELGSAVADLSKVTISGDAQPIIKQLLTLNAAAALTKKVGINIDPEAFRSRVTGTSINPNLELLFQGPKLRSFGFQFKLAPRSKTESVQIRKIVKFFKKGMAPLRSSEGASSFFLGAPMVFDIHFKGPRGDLNTIGKIKTCALQQCNINYTPDGIYNSYEDDSQPVALTLQLGFTELLPLYNDDYTYEYDSAGWDSPTSTQS